MLGSAHLCVSSGSACFRMVSVKPSAASYNLAARSCLEHALRGPEMSCGQIVPKSTNPSLLQGTRTQHTHFCSLVSCIATSGRSMGVTATVIVSAGLAI